ncbi:MAG: COG4223 family protein [Alphaproteobacteria bacterium]
MTASKLSTETDTDKTAPVSPLTNGADTTNPEARDQDDVQASDKTSDTAAGSVDKAPDAEARSPETGTDDGLATKPATAKSGPDDTPSKEDTPGTDTKPGAAAKQSEPAPEAAAARSSANPLMVVLAALLGALVAVLLTEGLRSNTVPAAVEAQLRDLRSTIDAIRVATGDPDAVTSFQESLSDLRNRIADAEAVSREAQRQAGSRASGGNAQGVAALQGSVGELTNTVSEVETRLAQLSGEVTQGQTRLQNRVAALESTTPANVMDALATKADEAAVEALAGRIGKLERNDVAQDARRAALALAVANLTRSSQTSAPFDTELQALSLLVKSDPAVGGMEQYAERGLPSLEDLRRDYAGVAPRVVRAWRTSENQGVLGQIWANILGSVSVRPIGEASGNTPPALVARAEQRLNEGNLAGAVQELERLQGESANAASAWLSAARSRLELDSLITDLNGRVIASIATEAGQPAAGE